LEKLKKYQHFDIYDYMSSVNSKITNFRNLSLIDIHAIDFERFSKYFFYFFFKKIFNYHFKKKKDIDDICVKSK